jgi:hypothetical protein
VEEAVYIFNMRSGRSIALLVLYLAFTAGFQVLVHTCGGHTSYYVMPASAQDPCGCSTEPEAERCCTTQLVTMKLDADQKASVPASPAPLPVAAAHAVHADLLLPDPSPRPVVGSTSPPSTVPIPILHCTFLI